MATEKEIILPNKHWENFFKKLKEIEDPNLKVSKWKDYHVLAYICQRFKEVYHRDYAVTIKGAPSKSPDMYMVKCVIATLGTSNMKTVKNFVDWVFEEKIVPSKMKIRSLAFFNSQGLANEFYFEMEKRNKITRATTLPEEYKSVAISLGLTVNTYGELAFIQAALRENAKGRESYHKLFLHLQTLGFEENVLEGLK